VDGDRGDRYGYDALGQVTDVKYDALDPQTGTPTDWSRRVQYQWDPVGNRKKVTEDGVATTYAANLVNQYTTVGGAALSYDGNGNLATVPAAAGPGGPWAYTYDAANRLIAAQSDAVRMEMVYDARNRCINRKTIQRLEGAWVASSDLWMGYDGWSLIEEGDALTGAIAAYVHGAQIDEVLARVDASGVVYYHADALGSTEFLTDASGSVVERYRYDVYGLPTVLDASGARSSPDPRTSGFGNRFLFTGREWLSDLGLYDYRHRVYSPALGRWLQPDPIRFAAGDVNLYRYCGNSPLLLCDSDGLAAHGLAVLGKAVLSGLEHAAIGAVVGGATGALGGGMDSLAVHNEVRGRNVAIGAGSGAVGGAVGGFVSGAMFRLDAGTLGGAIGSVVSSKLYGMWMKRSSDSEGAHADLGWQMLVGALGGRLHPGAGAGLAVGASAMEKLPEYLGNRVREMIERRDDRWKEPLD
jgi:RHS repeat-associated protein